MEKVKSELRACKSFLEMLRYVRDNEKLSMVTDNGWSWIEFEGVKIEGSERERFKKQSEIDDLLFLAGLTNKVLGTNKKRYNVDNIDPHAYDYLWK
jgi:hypothetical protein